MIVPHGNRLNEEPVQLAFEKRVLMRLFRNPDAKAKVFAGKVRKASSSVVDDNATRKTYSRWRARMRSGEYIQIILSHEGVDLILTQNILKRFARVIPTAKQLFVTMCNGNSSSGNAGKQRGRTTFKHLLQLGI